MSGYPEHLAADRRRAILLVLRDLDGTANESQIELELFSCGHRQGLTRDVVREELRWLADRDLVQVSWYRDVIAVATLTERGRYVSLGRIKVDGVKPPTIVEG